MSMKQFAVAHSCAADWEPEGDEMVVYRSDHGRMRISFENHNSLEYVVKSIGYRDGHPEDCSEVFADDLITAIRGHLSAHDIHMLLLRLARELSAWQFEPGLDNDKKPDVCGDAAKEISEIEGFENKDLATAVRIARQYRKAQSGAEEVKALSEIMEFAIGAIAEATPDAAIHQHEAEIDRLQCEIESLRQYEEMVINACGELETFGEYRAFLHALTGRREELFADAARYKKLRRLNVPQFQELFQINIKSGMPFDHLVDELP